jgi:hypothetical protein
VEDKDNRIAHLENQLKLCRERYKTEKAKAEFNAKQMKIMRRYLTKAQLKAYSENKGQ